MTWNSAKENDYEFGDVTWADHILYFRRHDTRIHDRPYFGSRNHHGYYYPHFYKYNKYVFTGADLVAFTEIFEHEN